MRSVKDRIADILEAINLIETEALVGRDVFMLDKKSHVWMIHHIQIIGEAVRSVTAQLVQLSPETPWSAIVGMRHVLVHDYFGIDLDEVWNVVQNDIPQLKVTVEKLLLETTNVSEV